MLKSRLIRLLWCAFAYFVRYFIPIKKGKVICWAYNFTQYGCQPKYITESILQYYSDDFEIVWAFHEYVNVSDLPKEIIIVKAHTFRYLIELYSSEFIIANNRIYKFRDFFFKKKGQKYIMTWHGPVSLKKIEFDAVDSLGSVYARRMKDDNKVCDLMLSNCRFFTNLIRNSFLYSGEILEKGAPRNDLFFDEKKKKEIFDRVSRDYSIPHNSMIVMYAPTFRTDCSIKHYQLDWSKIIDVFEKKYNKNVVFFVRLHPNAVSSIDINDLIHDKRLRNMCLYHDMQELLCISNVLITDYSSTMFDIGLLNKICILYADDVENYDRGFYFDIRKLPFPLSQTEDELIANILSFDMELYYKALDEFNNKTIKIYDKGDASLAVVEWMLSKMK